MNVHRLTSWSVWVVPIAAVALIVGCEWLQQAPQPDPVTPPAPQSDSATPPAPGEKLVEAGRDATKKDVVGAIGILAPAILGPWGLVLGAVARVWYLKRQGIGMVRDMQPTIDGLDETERAKLGESQSKATKRLIRQARGKSLNIPL